MNVFQRLWDSFGFNEQLDDPDYEYEYEEDTPQEFLTPPGAYDPNAQAAMPNNVVGLPNRRVTQTEMCVMEPRSFEEMPQAVMALRERKSIVLNLGLMDADLAQRCVDFVAGAAFAIDGHQERLGEHIFLFTPSFVQISSYPSMAQPLPARPPVSAAPVPPPAPAWSDKTRMMS